MRRNVRRIHQSLILLLLSKRRRLESPRWRLLILIITLIPPRCSLRCLRSSRKSGKRSTLSCLDTRSAIIFLRISRRLLLCCIFLVRCLVGHDLLRNTCCLSEYRGRHLRRSRSRRRRRRASHRSLDGDNSSRHLIVRASARSLSSRRMSSRRRRRFLRSSRRALRGLLLIRRRRTSFLMYRQRSLLLKRLSVSRRQYGRRWW